jgi:hydrogenase maturation protease
MILVIGYGNTLYSDDGIGPYIVDRLRDEITDDEAVLLTVHQLTAELTEPISRASSVIFVDVEYGAKPGQITCIEVKPSEDAFGLFSHHVTPTSLLSGAAVLYGKAPNSLLFSIGGTNFALGTTFSEIVRVAIPWLLEMIKERIVLCTNMVSSNLS